MPVQRMTKDVMDNCDTFVKDNILYMVCEYPTIDGMKKIVAKQSLRPIQRKLMAEFQDQASVSGIGWKWPSIKKAWKKVKKIAKKVASKKTLRKITKALNDPRVQAAMAAISTAYPAAGKAYSTVRDVSNSVNAAFNGDLNAIQKIAQLKNLANMSPDPNIKAKAQQAFAAAEKLYALKKIDVAQKAKKLLNKVTSGDKKSRQNFMRIADLALNGNKLAGNIIELMRNLYNTGGMSISGLAKPGYNGGSHIARVQAEKLLCEKDALKAAVQRQLQAA